MGLRGLLEIGLRVFFVSVIVCLSDAQQVGVAFAYSLRYCVKLRAAHRMQTGKQKVAPYTGDAFGKF